MATIKPSIPKGTRDFSPIEIAKRNYIFDTVKSVFTKFGYQEIQTPTIENLSTLTGKYGEEGDKLIFKILNSGDFLAKADAEKLMSKNSRGIIEEISEKALRYDLTIPFARYVVMHQNELTFPFKRFQIQPVWRADRPQKGRYREFYQCDVDVVGSTSLLYEAEFVLIYDEALSKLGLKDFTIHINNRKILSGIAEIIGKPDLIIAMTTAIDKLDKIGLDGVFIELRECGFTQQDIDRLKPIILLTGTNDDKIKSLRNILSKSTIGLEGIDELEIIFSYLNSWQLQQAKIELDITLARGLNYYTGAIFEVKTKKVDIGSLGGGGRYDDLTGIFGLKNLPGVGVSFGADRIYDLMEKLALFPEMLRSSTQVLISNFDSQAEKYALPLLQKLRGQEISAEIYPVSAKLKKQMTYANDKGIPYVILVGSEEMSTSLLTLRNMQSGQQEKLSLEQIAERLLEINKKITLDLS